jgi:hypothetical protein
MGVMNDTAGYILDRFAAADFVKDLLCLFL